MADDFMAKYLAERAEQKGKANEELKEICEKLDKKGVFKLVAEYSGSGDEGNINDVTAYGPSDKADADGPTIELDDAFVEEISDVIDTLLPDGYEINDGGQGTFTILVAAKKGKLEHQENYTETRDSEEEYDLD